MQVVQEALKNRDTEIKRRTEDLNRLTEEIHALEVKVEIGDDQAEEYAAEWMRKKVIVGNHKREIARLQKPDTLFHITVEKKGKVIMLPSHTHFTLPRCFGGGSLLWAPGAIIPLDDQSVQTKTVRENRSIPYSEAKDPESVPRAVNPSRPPFFWQGRPAGAAMSDRVTGMVLRDRHHAPAPAAAATAAPSAGGLPSGVREIAPSAGIKLPAGCVLGSDGGVYNTKKNYKKIGQLKTKKERRR